MQKIDKNMQIGIFALVVVVVAYIFGSRKGTGLSLNSSAAELDKEMKKNPLPYEPSQYAVFADRLEAAMFPLADNEEAVFSVFANMRTRSDVLQTITAFGKRRIQFTIGSSSLSTWISRKLTNKEVQNINEILSRNDIDYKF